MARKYYGLSRKYTRNTNQFINGLFKVGKSMATAYEREAKRQQREQARSVAAYNRYITQTEREQARQIRQHEMAMRRAEREREKAERERERAAKLQARLQEQQRVEDEIAQIEEDNELWTNIHTFVEHVVSLDEVKENITRCDFEQQNNVPDGFFETRYPSDSQSKQQAQNEADRKFDVEKAQKDYFTANKEWTDLVFEEIEPTTDSVTEELTAEAKETISAFLPWKQSKLRKAYVEEHLGERYKELHEIWQSKKDEFDAKEKTFHEKAEEKNRIATEMRQAKKDYITQRAKELHEAEIEAWKKERTEFYTNLRQSLQNVIDGDRNYVITAIGSLFPDDELPLEYFVDYTYEEEKGKVMIDLDLPEIEDLPDRKIVLTPTGKKSIRMKGQSDLRSDYAHCVFGLAMYVAHLIFNVSLKVQEIEISGYTQRKEANSAVATDQYVFVVSFTRELFEKIDFSRLSAIQVMDFFHRYFNMTKSFDMKQIDLATAYDRMESFTPADYQTFIATLPPVKEEPETVQKQSTLSNKSNTGSYSHTDDKPSETYDKAFQFMKDFYRFIDKLSKDSGVNRHAENLNGVNIKFTGGNFTGDGDINTYRGKLFFCAIIDLFKSLDKMKINLDSFTPSSYAFALFIIKIYMREEIQYSMLSKYEQVYHPYINMLKPMKNGIPTPSHFYLIGEILCDYERDMSWYRDYLNLMEQHIKIVDASIPGSSYKLKYVEDFLKFHQNLQIGNSSQSYSSSASSTNVDLQHLDPLLEDAARLLVSYQEGSTSYIQRKFAIGYNRCSRLFDQLEALGIVGPAQGSKPREVLIKDENTLNSLLSTL